MTLTAEQAGVPNEAAAYLQSLEDPEVIERVRCCISDAHIFKLPPRPTAGGWRGADWSKEVWQGTLKVVERGDLTVILLVDRNNGSIFAVCGSMFDVSQKDCVAAGIASDGDTIDLPRFVSALAACNSSWAGTSKSMIFFDHCSIPAAFVAKVEAAAMNE